MLHTQVLVALHTCCIHHYMQCKILFRCKPALVLAGSTRYWSPFTHVAYPGTGRPSHMLHTSLHAMQNPVLLQTSWAYLSACWVHQVLVALHTFALFKAIPVHHLGLSVASDDQDDITCGAVLQWLYLMTDYWKNWVWEALLCSCKLSSQGNAVRILVMTPQKCWQYEQFSILICRWKNRTTIRKFEFLICYKLYLAIMDSTFICWITFDDAVQVRSFESYWQIWYLPPWFIHACI